MVMKASRKEYLKNKIERIEKSINWNRQQIISGADKKLHSRNILSLNLLCQQTENELEKNLE